MAGTRAQLAQSDPADQILDALRELRAALIKTGTVTSAPSATRANVQIAGTTLLLPCLSSYTPAAGHVVKVCCLDPDAWFVLGRVQ